LQKITILQGLPASGKTTWALEFLKNNPGWIRTNKDELRAMCHASKFSKQNEKMIIEIRDQIILKALSEGLSVIVDDTNFEDKHYHHIYGLVRDLIEAGQLVIEVKFFEVSLDEALKRNSLREKKVPESVITSMYTKYIEKKTQQEIADTLNKDTFITPYVWQDPDMPKTIIVDIDGTVAIRKDRGPFDWCKVYNDDINQPVVDIVIRYAATHQIIFMSGRDEVCRSETERWIIQKMFNLENVKRVFPDYTAQDEKYRMLRANMLMKNLQLFMRPKNDRRKDSIVKMELFEQVRKQSYIDFILDDRNSVVKMWRDAGYLCLQVQYGDF